MSAAIEQAVVIRTRVDGTLEIVKLADELERLKAKAQTTAAGAAPLGAALGGVAQNAAMASAQVSALAGEAAKLHASFTSAGGGATGLLGAIGGLRGASAALLPITVGAVALGAAFAAIGPAIKAAAESSDSFRRLDAAIKQTGDTAAATFPAIERSIQAVFDASAFDDESLRRAATTFVTITGNAEDAAKAIGPIADLAAATGASVESAAHTVALATEGMTRGLKQAGIILSDSERKFMEAAAAGQRLAFVLGKIEEKVGGRAASELGTYAGQVANMKKHWGELAEGLGAVFLPAATSVIGVLADIAKAIRKVTDELDAAEWLTSGGTSLITRPLGEAIGYGGAAPGMAEILRPTRERPGQPLHEAPQPYFPDVHEPGFVKAGADADKKALDEANAAAKAYRETVDSLLGRDKGFATDIRATVEAFTKLKASMGEDAAMKAFGPALADIADKVKSLGIEVPAASRSVLDLAVANRSLGEELAAEKKAFEEYMVAAAKAAAELGKLREEIRGIATEGRAAIDALGLPQAVRDSLNAQISKVERDTQNTITLSLFFPPETRAAIQQGAIDFQKGVTNASVAAGTEMAKNMKEALEATVARFQEAVHDLGQVMGDVFLDLAETGGANFGKIAAQLFVKGVRDGADQLAEMFGNIVVGAFGGVPDEADPKFLDTSGKFDQSKFNKAQQDAADQQAAVMGALNGAIGLIGQTMNIFANAKKGEAPSVLGTTISFAAAGASIGSAINVGLGTVIGAAIGAIVGAIVGLLASSKAKKEQPYAAYGIRDGEAYVEAYGGQERQFENVTASMRNDMLQRMNRTMEETSNGYIKLLLKFPNAVAQSVAEMDFQPSMDQWSGKVRGWLEWLVDPMRVNLLLRWSGIQKPAAEQLSEGQLRNPNYDKKAQKNFLEDFNNWVANTLPKEIAASFRDQTAEAFTAMGMTVTQFTIVWDKLQGMDPTEALQVFYDMADALIAFDQLLMSMRGFGRKFLEGLRGGQELDQYGRARPEGMSKFEADVATAYMQLDKLGQEVFTLIGPEQVAAAKALGQGLLQLESGLISFLNTIIEIRQQLSKEIADMRFEIAYDQAATPQAQSDLLMQQYRNVVDQINNAAALGLSPDDVRALTQEALGLVSRIYQLDTKGRADWADAELAKLDTLQTQVLRALGDAAISLFQEVVNSMQPVIDWFKGLPEVVGDPLDALAASARDAADALDWMSGNWKTRGEAPEPAPVVAAPPSAVETPSPAVVETPLPPAA